jgi:probable F420-dependent oxidoreductase
MTAETHSAESTPAETTPADSRPEGRPESASSESALNESAFSEPAPHGPASPAIEFAVQGRPRDRAAWLDLARRVDGLGFRRLYCADHPGLTMSPAVALAAAAAVTSSVRLGALVMNVGVHEPFDIAADVAALDVLSEGRAILGLGAGHTPKEWTQTGRAYPSARERVGRYLEVVAAVRALLADEEAEFDGDHVRLDAARLENPRPLSSPVPLLLGGNGPRLLRHAGAHADIISLSGLGKTLADGHSHQVLWHRAEIDKRLEFVARGIAERGAGGTATRGGETATRVGETATRGGETSPRIEDRPGTGTPAGSPARESASGRQADRGAAGSDGPVLEALVQRVAVTDDAEAEAARFLAELGNPDLSPAELLDAPYVLIGTAAEIAAKIRRTALERNITAYAIRETTLDDVALIRAALAEA